jgi:hypothetical protein
VNASKRSVDIPHIPLRSEVLFQSYGSRPARRAATTASPRVCAPSFRIAERR